MSEFPELAVKPGEYACSWFVGKESRPGQIELNGNRLPRLDLFDDKWADAAAGSIMHSFGQSQEVDRLVGKMRSNHDVVLVSARIDSGLPGWAFGVARFAIVGLGVDRVHEDRYERLVLQVTGADRFFGASPVKDWSWPARSSRRAEQRYSVLVNPDARWRWRDRTEGMSVVCSYARQLPLHKYRFELAFAPVVEFIADSPLTLDEWVTRWLQPLVDVASLASGDPQRLAWLTVHSGTGRKETSGVVFGGGIAQAPYRAGYDDEWRRSGRRPLFTFATLPVQLPVLLRRWRRLGSGESPFVALYRLALLDPDLPLRARYLYLIQALEALHGHENRAKEEKAQRRFAADREKYIVHQATVLHEQLGVLRNDLSHGRRSYPDGDLRPWVECVDLICRAHLLRLLGFNDAAIVAAVATAGS